MKLIYGNDIEQLMNNLSNMTDNDEKKHLTEIVKDLGMLRAIEFIKMIQDDPIMNFDYITEQYELSNGFINKNMIYNDALNYICIATTVKRVLIEMLNDSIEAMLKNDLTERIITSPSTVLEVAKLKAPVRLTLKLAESRKLLDILNRKKAFIRKSDFSIYVYENFQVYHENAIHNLSQEAVLKIVEQKWYSLKSLKLKHEIKHDKQMYRVISRSNFIHLVFKGYLESGKKTQSRYVEIF